VNERVEFTFTFFCVGSVYSHIGDEECLRCGTGRVDI
jgi:hypothetical protein